MFYGDRHLSKSSPFKYLESFFTEYAPECKNKWVNFDQGGKLCNNFAVKNIIHKFGYEILPTTPDASFQNGIVKYDNQTVSQGIKSVIISTGLNIKFWPYAFMHVLQICNALPA